MATLKEYFYPSNSSDYDAGALTNKSQSFVAESSYTVSEVKLKLKNASGSPHHLYGVYLYDAAVTGLPTGAALVQFGSFYVDELSTSYVEYSFNDASVAITDTNEYVIVVLTAEEVTTSNVYWYTSATEQYATGTAGKHNHIVGWSVLGDEHDRWFECYEAGAAPTKAENPTPANDATEVDFSGLELSWDDGGGADTFNVYIGKTGALTLVSSAQAGTDYTTTIAELETIFGASPINQKVYWRVDATNDAGTTEGDEWNFDPRPAKASTPSPTDAMTTMTLDWSAFSWDEATAALTYDVYAGTETGEGIPDSNMTLIVADGELYTMAQAYMLTAMNVVYPNTGAAVHSYTYYWKVNTKNAFGVTEGDFWSFTTIDFDQPRVAYGLITGGSGAGPYDDPPGVEGTDWQFTGENNLITIRKLVAAANNKIWYEEM